MARCWSFVSVSMGEYQSEDSFVRFSVKPTQRACARDFFWDRKKTREGKIPGQSIEESSQQKSGEGDGQRKTTAKRGVGTCELRNQVSERERMSQRSWWLCRNFAQIHARDSQMHQTENHTKVPQTSPFLCLKLTQVRDCLFLFSSTLSAVYVVSCVFVK